MKHEYNVHLKIKTSKYEIVTIISVYSSTLLFGDTILLERSSCGFTERWYLASCQRYN